MGKMPTNTGTADYLAYSSVSAPARTRLPFAAMVLGILSGPIGIGLAVTAHFIFDRIEVAAGGMIFLGVIGTTICFAAIVNFRRPMTRRNRILALIGLIMPAMWAAIVFAYIIWIVFAMS